MTPKEKAEELVIKMYGHTIGKPQAKNCAIVAVGELIGEADDNTVIIGRGKISNKEYWLQVKTEIEAL